jgi:tetratricopeptide (TPR) repeat protein
MPNLSTPVKSNACVLQRIFQAGAILSVSLLLLQPNAFAKSKVMHGVSGNLDPARTQFLKATELHNQRKYSESASAFESFLRDFPGHALAPDACMGRAISLRKGSQLQAAATAYQECAQRYPFDPHARFCQLQAAGLWESLGNLQQAAEIYQSVVHGAPDNGEATYHLARTFRELQKVPEARETLRLFLEWKPGDDSYRLAGLMELRELIQGDPKQKETLRKIDEIIQDRFQKLQPGDDIFNISKKSWDGTSTKRTALC